MTTVSALANGAIAAVYKDNAVQALLSAVTRPASQAIARGLAAHLHPVQHQLWATLETRRMELVAVPINTPAIQLGVVAVTVTTSAAHCRRIAAKDGESG
jgi:hypothetical protein